MTELAMPWLELAILLPVCGAIIVHFIKDPQKARFYSLVASGGTLLAVLAAWINLVYLHKFQAHDRWDICEWLFSVDLFVIDELSAPLLPLAALQFFLTELATLRTKVRRFSFAWTLASEAILLATLACEIPLVLIALLILGTLPPLVELQRRNRSSRVYVLHLLLFVLLLAAGEALVAFGTSKSVTVNAGLMLLTAAVLVRNGVAPFHCWLADLFDKASFGTALLFTTPLVGAYAAMRLVMPTAPLWMLQLVSIWSLATAVYCSGMAFAQTESRRFYCYLLLSHASLVLIGLEIATPIGLAGALCMWLSVGIGLLGFGLTLRAVETRTGRLSLARFNGLYEAMPSLAGFFLLTGLASIGFPGTVGFIAVDLLVEGTLRVYPFVGAVVVLTTAVNGIAVMHAYFRIFTGKVDTSTIDLHSRKAESLAVLTLSLLILGGGFYPQPGVASRYHAAQRLIETRTARLKPEYEVRDRLAEILGDLPVRKNRS